MIRAISQLLVLSCQNFYKVSKQYSTMGADIIGFAYAATVAAGGIMGYAKAGSIPSLGAGLLFGSILGYGAYQMSQDSSNYTLSLGTSAVLGGMMGYRYYSSGKFMPAGLVCVFSVAMVTRLLLKQSGILNIGNRSD